LYATDWTHHQLQQQNQLLDQVDGQEEEEEAGLCEDVNDRRGEESLCDRIVELQQQLETLKAERDGVEVQLMQQIRQLKQQVRSSLIQTFEAKCLLFHLLDELMNE